MSHNSVVICLAITVVGCLVALLLVWLHVKVWCCISVDVAPAKFWRASVALGRLC
jgi:hypothetical protein